VFGLSSSEESVRSESLTALAFRDAAEVWLNSRRPYISAKTAHEYALNIKTLSIVFGEMRLQEITPDQVRAYQKMRMTQCGPFAINHECCVLSQMRKRIGKPFEDYQPLPLPKEKRGRALRDDEKKHLFEVAASDPNWLACCCFARISANTTAGPKEVMTLRLKDVDLDLRVMRVQPEGAKNVHRIRTIPLNPEAFEAMQLAIKRAKSLGSHEPDHFIFPFRTNKGKKHDPRRHQTTFKTAWKKLTGAAGVGMLRMYDLRHTAITNLLQDPTVSDETAEALAGHIDPHTKKRYSHTHLDKMREAVEALNGPRRRPPAKAKAPEPEENRADLSKAAEQLMGALAKLLQAR
jgi:integrase